MKYKTTYGLQEKTRRDSDAHRETGSQPDKGRDIHTGRLTHKLGGGEADRYRQTNARKPIHRHVYKQKRGTRPDGRRLVGNNKQTEIQNRNTEALSHRQTHRCRQAGTQAPNGTERGIQADRLAGKPIDRVTGIQTSGN